MLILKRVLSLSHEKVARDLFCRRGFNHEITVSTTACVNNFPTFPPIQRNVNDQHSTPKKSSSRLYSSTTINPFSHGPDKLTNGMYLKYSMMYYDSVAFLTSNRLGIPKFIGESNKTPKEVAKEFNLSVRGASALLVTLCRLEIVEIVQDNEDSVDDIVYALTPSAKKFLSDESDKAFFSPFADTLTNHFITPDSLLECARPEEKKDIMSEHLERGDDDIDTDADEADDDGGVTARHFMRHMNAQSYSCARAFARVASNLESMSGKQNATLLDVGGGSAIYGIEACKSNPNLNGVVFELPKVKPITEEYIDDAGLSERIAVHSGDFFRDPFPGPVDAVLFSNILHDWPDEINVNLIEKAFECLSPGGQIIISELLLSDDVKSSSESSTCMNVVMLPFTKGRQYRPKELFARLKTAGFENPHVVHLVDDYDLVVGTKP